ncbi:hypothetical protein [Gracilimonas sp.]
MLLGQHKQTGSPVVYLPWYSNQYFLLSRYHVSRAYHMRSEAGASERG